jgi:hypothetical protein
MSGDLPPHVQVFLATYARSLEELAILLALIESRTRWWDVASMAVRSGITPLHARRVLDAFAARNLLDIRISDDVRYRLRPGTPALAHDVDAVVGCYRRSPTQLHQWAAAHAARLRSGAGT